MTAKKHTILPPEKWPRGLYKKSTLNQQIEEACMCLNDAQFLGPKTKDLQYSRRWSILQTLLWIKENEALIREYAAAQQAAKPEEEIDK